MKIERDEMQIIPFKAIQDIPTGNPYKENVEIFSGKTLMEVAFDFPFHTVFKKNEFSKFVTSIIMNEALHVVYDEKGSCVGVAVMAPYKPEHDHDLIWDDINFLKQPFDEVVDILRKRGCDVNEDADDVDSFNIVKLGLSVQLYEESNETGRRVESIYVHLKNMNQ